MICRPNPPPCYRQPAPDAHKYARGAVLVASGGVASTGAARLAARAALRTGAGLVTILSPPAALAVNAAQLTAIMVARCESPAAMAARLAEPRARGLVLGPGFGADARCRLFVLATLSAAIGGKGLVLDADALTAFANRPDPLFAALGSARAAGGRIILTPHAGEFARLFPDLAPLSDDDEARLAAALTAARRAQAVILLKGARTLIVTPDGEAVLNDHATPWLATAGSGDVLAGIIAGWMACQQGDAYAAGCAAAWMHGAAGLAVGPGLIAEDLPEALPAVIRDLTTRGGPSMP